MPPPPPPTLSHSPLSAIFNIQWGVVHGGVHYNIGFMVRDRSFLSTGKRLQKSIFIAEKHLKPPQKIKLQFQ